MFRRFMDWRGWPYVPATLYLLGACLWLLSWLIGNGTSMPIHPFYLSALQVVAASLMWPTK